MTVYRTTHEYRTGYTGSEGCYTFLGRSHPPSGTVPVIFSHGWVRTSQTTAYRRATGTGLMGDTFRAIADAGLPVFVPDLGGANTWGNSTYRSAVDALVTWANTVYGTRTDKVCLMGESMGATGALNWGWRNTGKIAAVYLTSPVVALDALHDRDTDLATQMHNAFGSEAAYNAALPTHDPIQNHASITFGSKMFTHYGSTDTTVLPAEVTAFASAVGCTAESITGGHTATADADPDDVAAWILATVEANS